MIMSGHHQQCRSAAPTTAIEPEGAPTGKRLLAATALNLTITILEVCGGIAAGSLALVSDALHNFSDGLALLFSYAATRIAQREKDRQKTFGYKRAQIVAAMVNGSVLVGMSLFLIKEAVTRFASPRPIQGLLVAIIAASGLIANLGSVLLLRRYSQKYLNVRSAYLHLLADTLSSVAVLSSGILFVFLHSFWLDPLLTILINLYIMRGSYGVLKKTLHILMQGAPEHIDLEETGRTIRAIPGVEDVHHIHVWSMDDRHIHFEAHVNVADMPVSKTREIYAQIEARLRILYGVQHLTIQFEHRCCEGAGLIARPGIR